MYHVMFIAGMTMAVLFFGLSVFLYVRQDVARLIAGITGCGRKRAVKKSRSGTKKRSKPAGRKKEILAAKVKTAVLPECAVTVRLCSGNPLPVLAVTDREPLPDTFRVMEDIIIYYTEENL